jgi:DNA-binding Lrp family transcriptional regulator
VDELDAVILQELQRDARLSNKDLAERLSLAPSTCLERTRRLQLRGALRGYHADVSLAVLGRHVQALVAVSVRPLRRDTIDAFQQYLSQLPEVMSTFVLAGGDDFLLHVGVPSIDQLHAFLIDKLSARRDVVSFRTSTIFRHTRKTVLEPLSAPD